MRTPTRPARRTGDPLSPASNPLRRAAIGTRRLLRAAVRRLGERAATEPATRRRRPAVPVPLLLLGLAAAGCAWLAAPVLDLRSVLLVAGLVLAAGLLAVRVTRPYPGLGAVVVLLTAAGAGAQARLAGEAQQVVVPLAAVVVGLLLGDLGGRLLQRALADGFARALGLGLAATAILLRLSSVLLGDPESGAVQLAGRSLHVGELVRVLFVVATACLLAESTAVVGALRRRGLPWPAGARWFLGVWAPSGLVLAAMVLLRDAGPALVLAVALAGMLYRCLGPGLAAVPLLSAAAGFVWLAPRSSALTGRWQDLRDPAGSGADQLGRALRALGETGLVGRGGGSSTLVTTLPANNSDYLPATIGADAGLLVLLVLFALALWPALRLLRAGVASPGVPGLVVTGAGLLLGVPALWTGLGNLGLVPFSGIDVPFLAANGTSCLASGLTLALAVRMLGSSGRDGATVILPALHLSRGTRVVAGAAVVAASLQAGWLTASGGPRLAAEALLRDRGALWTADGRLLAAASAGNGPRVYPDPFVAQLGWLAPGYSATGVEKVAGGLTTCGRHLGAWGRLGRLGLAAECAPAQATITTVDARVQAVTDAAASRHGRALVVVTDARTGGVVAASSSSTVDPEALDDLTSGSPRRNADLLAELPAGLDHPVFTRQLPPGSTFKLVTGAAAELEGVRGPVPGASYQAAPGMVVRNSWGGPCPDGSTVTMLARSCNTTAARDASEVGADRLSAVAAGFGFDTANPLVGPAYPASPSVSTSWSPGTPTLGFGDGAPPAADLARAGFGQAGVRSSVWGISYATAVVASRGQVPRPTFVAGNCTAGQLQPWASGPADPRAARARELQVTPQELTGSLDTVYLGMRRAVTDGTAAPLAGLAAGREIAAKTGTADTTVDGTPAVVSWVTVILDQRTVLTVAVLPDADHPRPEPGAAAIDVAAEVVPLLPQPQPTRCPGHEENAR